MSKETKYLVNIMLSSLTNSQDLLEQAKQYEEELAANLGSLTNSQSK